MEVKYFEAIVIVSGTARLGVYARNEEEAFNLLEEHVETVGIDRHSPDVDLYDFEVDPDIMEYGSSTVYEVINSKDDFQE